MKTVLQACGHTTEVDHISTLEYYCDFFGIEDAGEFNAACVARMQAEDCYACKTTKAAAAADRVRELAAGLDPLSQQSLDTITFAELLGKAGITVSLVEDFNGDGTLTKSIYHSPKSNRTIYVLERSGVYSGDGFGVDVWQFDRDFTVEEASALLSVVDADRRAAREGA